LALGIPVLQGGEDVKNAPYRPDGSPSDAVNAYLPHMVTSVTDGADSPASVQRPRDQFRRWQGRMVGREVAQQ